MYLNYYLLISLLLSVICITKIKYDTRNIKNIENIDPFEKLNELDENLDELKEKSEFLGNLFEKLIDSILDGSNVTLAMFIITISLIPLFRWILIVITFKK